MTRQVYDNRMTAHVWANQSQPSGRSNNGNLSFDCAKLYSYRTVIGYIMPDSTPLYTATRYSVTTGGHMSDLNRALGWNRGHAVPDLDSLVPYLEDHKRGKRDKDAYYIRNGKAGILRYLEKHALSLGDTSGDYLSGLIGLTFTKVKAKAERKARQVAAVEAARVKAEQLEHARKIATRSAKEVADWKAQVKAEYNPAYKVDQTCKKLRLAHIAAKKAGWTQVTAKCWAVLKDLRAFKALLEDNAGLFDRNRALRAHIVGLRNYFTIAGSAGAEYEFSGYDLGEIARHAQQIAVNGKGLSPVQRQNLADFVAQTKAREANRREVERVAAIRAREEAERNRALAQAERVEKWLAGENAGYGFRADDSQGGALLRVKEGELQTSWGANVPLPHAIRVFKFVKGIRQANIDNPESETTWRRNGHTIRVGHFTLDEIRADGSFVAGCHVIFWPEIERVAQAVGVYDVAPSDEAVTATAE